MRTGIGKLRRVVLLTSFQLLYRFGGRGYDLLVRVLFGSAWDEFRASAIDFVEEGPVLDLGCGTGRLLALFEGHGIPVYGIDRSRSMLAAARRSGVRGLLRADFRALPLAAASLGAVIATFPAPDIADRATLAEIARVLRPGGRFIVVLGGLPRQGAFSPRGLALRLAYGSQRLPQLPSADLLFHEALPGEWRRVMSGSGSAVLWIAARSPER